MALFDYSHSVAEQADDCARDLVFAELLQHISFIRNALCQHQNVMPCSSLFDSYSFLPPSPPAEANRLNGGTSL